MKLGAHAGNPSYLHQCLGHGQLSVRMRGASTKIPEACSSFSLRILSVIVSPYLAEEPPRLLSECLHPVHRKVTTTHLRISMPRA